jgi:amino acid adenylation domain-containing protein
MSEPPVADLLAELSRAGITLWAEDGRLRFRAPAGAMTAERKAAVQAARPALLALLAGHGGISAAPPVARTDACFPLSANQNRFLAVEAMADVGAAHTIGGAAWLEGPLSIRAFEAAWGAVVARHAALRTRFERRPEGLRQRIEPSTAPPLVVADAAGDAAEAAACALAGSRIDPFEGPPVRAGLWQVSSDRFAFAAALHHAVGDGWSVGILLRDLAGAYSKAVALGPGASALPLAPAYAEVAAAGPDRDAVARDLAWWREQLEGWPRVFELPPDRPRPPIQSFAGDRVRQRLRPARTERMRALARRLSISVFACFAALFGAVLSRLAAANRMLLGLGVVGRDRPGLEEVVGPFVNTLPLPVGCDWDAPAIAHLQEVGRRVRDALARQTLSFDVLIDGLDLARDTARPPLVQVLMTEQIARVPLNFVGLRVTPIDVVSAAARMDLYLSLEWDGSGGLTLELEYASALFARSRAAAILDLLVRVGDRLIDAPETPLATLLAGRVPAHLPGTILAPDRDEGLADRFTAAAAAAADRTAVIAAGAEPRDPCMETLTYAALEARARATAGRLKTSGIQPGDVVAIDMQRSSEALLATLGTVLAGAAYLPLDAERPDPRWPSLLVDAGVRLVLRHAATASRAGDSEGPPTLLLDGEGPAPGLLDARRDPVWDNLPAGDRPGYVMFTSGSTGQPKAVAVGQRAILRLVDGVADGAAPPGAGIAPRVMLAASPAGFDAATLELWVPLLTGATVAIAPPGPPVPAELARFLIEARVDTAWFTAGLFNALVEAVPEALAGIGTVLAGGDRLSPPHVDRLLGHMRRLGRSNGRIVNGYGPTEATTFATLHALTPGDPVPAAVPIGRPIGGTEIRLLDAQLRPVPAGAVGEIAIGGAGLAAGYVGDPARTAQRFVRLPDRGARFFLTGDQGRIATDGTLLFLGRTDEQVKLRGFRVEPGEIEAVLARQPGVATAAVAVKGEGRDKRLVGYVVLESGDDRAPPTRDALIAALKAELPTYMLPAGLEVLEALPLGPTGKLDRAALPEPPPPVAPVGAPLEGAAQRSLAAAWAQALRIDADRLIQQSDFFAMGGDSIIAMHVAHLLALDGWRMSLIELIRNPTLSAVASALRRDCGRIDRPAAPDLAGPVPLAPIQARLLPPAGAPQPRFAQAVWLELAGPTDRLAASLEALARGHGALRFRLEADGPLLAAESTVALLRFAAGVPDGDVEAMTLARLDLAAGPVLAAGCRDRDGQGADLLVAAHHGVIDLAGWRFLLADLARLLGEEPDDPASGALEGRVPGASWRGYLQALTALADARAGVVAQLPAPGLRLPPPEALAGVSRKAERRLDQTLSERLIRDAGPVAGARLEDALVAALAAALAPKLDDAALRIDLEHHGRDLPGVPAIGLVGWCTVLCPIQLDEVPRPTAAGLARAAGARGALPLEGRLWLAWETLASDPSVRDRAARVPRAWAVVNLQSAIDAEPDGPRPKGPLRLVDRMPEHLEGPELVRSHPVELAARRTENGLHLMLRADPAAGQAEMLLDAVAEWLIRLGEALDRDGAGARDVRIYPQAPLDQAGFERALARLADGTPAGPLVRKVEDVLPLAPQQLGMMLESLNSTDPQQHLEQLRIRVDRPLDVRRLEAAWARVVARHPALRTAIVPVGGVWVQIVLQEGGGAVATSAGPEEAAAACDLRPFAHDQIGLCRMTHVADAGGATLILTIHHAIVDGWSMARVLADLQSAYQDPDWRLPPEPGMAPYLEWLARRADPSFWQRWFDRLPDWRRFVSVAADAEPRRRTLTAEIGSATVEALEALARARGVAPATLAPLAVAAVLMTAEARQATALFLTDAGRPADLPELTGAVGMFLATIPLGVAQCSGPVLAQAPALAKAIRRAVDHQPLPPLPHPVADTLVVFENYPRPADPHSPAGPRIIEVRGTGARTRFALGLLIVPVPDASPREGGRVPASRWRLELVIDRTRISDTEGEAFLAGVVAVFSALTDEGADWSALIGAARTAAEPIGLPRPRRSDATACTLATPNEALVAATWRQVLGHDGFGLEDRFDTVGGHSLGLVVLAEALAATLGRPFPVTALAETPTVKGHARLLDRLVAEEQPEPAWAAAGIAQLKDGPGQHLLILPGAAGEPSAYRALAEALPADWRVDAAGYRDTGDPEALARALADRIDAADLASPLLVLGHSFGAAVAASLAALVTSPLAGLCLVDQPFPARAAAAEALTDEALARDIAGAAACYHARPAPLPSEGTPAGRLVRALADADLLPDPSPESVGQALILRYREAILSLAGWRPPRLAVPLLIVRAASSEATADCADPALGWSPYARASFATATVPGGHVDLLRPPAVADLAGRLTAFVRADVPR